MSALASHRDSSARPLTYPVMVMRGSRSASISSRTKLGRKPAEGVDDDVGLLLAVQAADVDEQWLPVGKAKLLAEARVAAMWPELTELDPEWDDVDLRNAEGP